MLLLSSLGMPVDVKKVIVTADLSPRQLLLSNVTHGRKTPTLIASNSAHSIPSGMELDIRSCHWPGSDTRRLQRRNLALPHNRQAFAAATP